jgi:hypothetical protein
LNYLAVFKNGAASVVNGCITFHVPGFNRFLLLNDAGSGLLVGPGTVGTAATLQNSQRSVDLLNASICKSPAYHRLRPRRVPLDDKD